jgi:hypothetical protein
MAVSMEALSNPMLSKFATASARCAPIVRVDGSLNCGATGGVSVVVEGTPAPAGEGVEGTFVVVEALATGAGGGAGVAADDAGAGVDGVFEEDAAAAGAAFG